jgi:tRNA pseudouridine32 synthase/23S rRNA pseudouridine746 synthase/23S rRNA pseudouridine1911/1915/1917 synthase
MKHTADKNGSLLEVLHEMAPESSKNTLRSWLQSGRVSVAGKPADRANMPIFQGQEVLVGSKVTFLKGALRILHDDDQLVVLEKPEGLLSVATDKETRATVHAMLKRQFHNRRVYPVHRLDRETSGVMLFVYNERARDDLRSQFEQHTVDKTYFAIVEKEMPTGKGMWESYLEEDDFYYVKSTNDSVKGKRAVTHYDVLKAYRNRSLLRLKPQTGRKNQLRVHCSEAGHPIIGDKKYGSHTNPLKRVCLHAQKLIFTHPATGRRMTFAAPLPELFSKIFEFNDLAI